MSSLCSNDGAEMDLDEGTLSEELENKEAELNELLDEIDALQDEVDSLNAQATDTRTVLVKMQNDEIRRQKISKEKELATIYKLPSTLPRIDRSQLTEEHQDYLKQYDTRIQILVDELEKVKVLADNEEEELNAVIAENQELERQKDSRISEHMKVKNQLRKLRDEKIAAEERISSIDLDIRAFQRVVTDTETFITGQIEKESVLKMSHDSVADLQKRIDILEQQIGSVSNNICAIDYEIEELADELKEKESKHDIESQRLRKMVPWPEPKPKPRINRRTGRAEPSEEPVRQPTLMTEKDRLEDELKVLNAEIKDTRSESDKLTKRIGKLQDRYAALLPIAKKWAPLLRGTESNEDEDGPSTDALLKECKAAGIAADSDNTSEVTELATLQHENYKLEESIARMRQELATGMERFNIEVARLKSQIDTGRTQAFEKECAIQEKIKAIRLRLAQKKVVRKK